MQCCHRGPQEKYLRCTEPKAVIAEVGHAVRPRVTDNLKHVKPNEILHHVAFSAALTIKRQIQRS